MVKILKNDFKYFLLAGDRVKITSLTGESPAFLVSEDVYNLLMTYNISIYTKVERENGKVFCLGDYAIEQERDKVKILLHKIHHSRVSSERSSHKIYFGSNDEDDMIQFKLSLI